MIIVRCFHWWIILIGLDGDAQIVFHSIFLFSFFAYGCLGEDIRYFRCDKFWLRSKLRLWVEILSYGILVSNYVYIILHLFSQ
jgi:hypothetical protein